MPRPRKVSDAAVMEATHRVMQQVGPDQLTLARIAVEAGVTAGALVQRFGSRRGLMLALMAEFAGCAPAFFARLRAGHPSPLAALRAYAEWQAGMADTPAALAHHLAYLQIDLTDPDFHSHLATHARDSSAELRRLVEDAVTAGELSAATPVEPLTRVIQSVVTGSLFVWATLREGTAVERTRGDLKAVLAAYLTPGNQG